MRIRRFKSSASVQYAEQRVHAMLGCAVRCCVQMVSRELEKECVVVFDEAHNIDNVCIEALSVNLRKQTLQAARNNIRKLHDVSNGAT